MLQMQLLQLPLKGFSVSLFMLLLQLHKLLVSISKPSPYLLHVHFL